MAEVDYVIPELKISRTGVIDFKEVYDLMEAFLLQKRYDLVEKEQGFDENGSFKMKWWAFKKVDDYTTFNIEVTASGSGIKDVLLKKKKALSGKFVIKFESYLEKDYEGRWEEPVQKFLRGLYDKFILGSKFDVYIKELKEETYALYNEVKSYLGVNKV